MMFSVVFIGPTIALAANSYGLDETVGNTGVLADAFNKTKVDGNDNFLTFRVGSLIGVALSFVGVIFMALIIYAGLLWMTSAGNEQNVTKAKALMVAAAIGLIIILGAYALTAFIGAQLT